MEKDFLLDIEEEKEEKSKLLDKVRFQSYMHLVAGLAIWVCFLLMAYLFWQHPPHGNEFWLLFATICYLFVGGILLFLSSYHIRKNIVNRNYLKLSKCLIWIKLFWFCTLLFGMYFANDVGLPQ